MKIPGSSPNESINKNRQTIDEWNTTSVKLKNYGQKRGREHIILARIHVITTA